MQCGPAFGFRALQEKLLPSEFGLCLRKFAGCQPFFVAGLFLLGLELRDARVDGREPRGVRLVLGRQYANARIEHILGASKLIDGFRVSRVILENRSGLIGEAHEPILELGLRLCHLLQTNGQRLPQFASSAVHAPGVQRRLYPARGRLSVVPEQACIGRNVVGDRGVGAESPSRGDGREPRFENDGRSWSGRHLDRQRARIECQIERHFGRSLTWGGSRRSAPRRKIQLEPRRLGRGRYGRSARRARGVRIGASGAAGRTGWHRDDDTPIERPCYLRGVMGKRLDFLLKVTSSGSDDPFAWYGLAMEYRSLSRLEEAVATFEALRGRTPDYTPMYLMCGQVLESLGRLDQARAWLSAGIEVAETKRDDHAVAELRTALGALG